MAGSKESKPDTFSLIDEVNQIHHIGIEDLRSGFETKEAFKIFLDDVEKVGVMFVYNKKFYNDVLKSEIFRMQEKKMMSKFRKTKMVCLAQLLKKEFFGRIYKFPEAYSRFMGREMTNENFLENMREMVLKLKIINPILD